MLLGETWTVEEYISFDLSKARKNTHTDGWMQITGVP